MSNNLLEFLEAKNVVEKVPFVLPQLFTVPFLLVFFVFFLRFFFWLSWDTPRGERFRRHFRLSRSMVFAGRWSTVWRWYLHIDENGNDLDTVR